MKPTKTSKEYCDDFATLLKYDIPFGMAKEKLLRTIISDASLDSRVRSSDQPRAEKYMWHSLYEVARDIWYDAIDMWESYTYSDPDTHDLHPGDLKEYFKNHLSSVYSIIFEGEEEECLKSNMLK